MKSNHLSELIAHSVKVGSNPDLVQASGGNTSWKDGKKLWVKGSGKRLKDAVSQDIFSSIDFEKLSEREILALQDFSAFTTNAIDPSIESNIHIFIGEKFVTHLHSLGSIAIGVSSNNFSEIDFDTDVCFIPYARPGVDLAKAIKEKENYLGKILILQNHGVIFSGTNCEEVEKKIENFELEIDRLYMRIPSSKSFPDWIEILTSGVLTPDEAVFLGEKPFVNSEFLQTDSIAINSAGDFLFPNGLSDDRIELAMFYVRVAKLIERKTFVSYLTESEVQGLLSWDREKIRIQMAK